MTHPKIDNPFAYRRRQRFSGWAGWGAIAVVTVLTVFVAPRVCNWFLLDQLADGISELPLDSQAKRIEAAGQLGVSGVPILVQSLSHDDRGVARVAFQTLQLLQDESMQQGPSSGVASHYAITNELVNHIGIIQPDRHPWIRQLLNKTLLDTLDIDLQRAQTSYRTAASLLAQISLPPDPLNVSPPLLTNRFQIPQEVNEFASVDPSIPTVESPTEPLAFDPPNRPQTNDNALDEKLWVDPSQKELPTTSQKMVETSSLEPEMLASGAPIADAPQALPIGGPAPILSAGGYPTNGALEAYSTRAVIDLLTSIRKPLAQSARSELIRRGFQPGELSLALRLSSINAEVRNSLIDEVTNRSDIDPRRWLMWLADDAERSVRMKALSALGTMDDPNVAKELRSLLATERDPAVAARIRQALLR